MVLVSTIAFAALELVAIARYPSEVEWGRPVAWAYLLLLLSLLAVGVYGWAARRRSGEDGA